MSGKTIVRGAVIVAGGSGTRMGGEVPKQFLPLGAEGKPVLVHTVERFVAALPSGAPVVVVLPAAEIERWRGIAREWNIPQHIGVGEGGETRFESVKNGLQSIACDVVAIHDGVRPLVSTELINRMFECAETNGSAIPYVRPVDSFRTGCGDGGTEVCDRSRLMAVQTPQTFRYGAIRQAYETVYDPRFTDDASVFEAAGGKVCMCEGERQNIKVTTPLDLTVADALIAAGY